MFAVIDPSDFVKPLRSVSRVFLHCSASDALGAGYVGLELAVTVDKWHKSRGWSGVGYHFLIDKFGTLVAGRNIDLVPAAQKGHNTGTIAICVHGLEVNKFTQAQEDTLYALCHEINKVYDGRVSFHGHKEVEPNKECPVFDYKEWLSLDKTGHIQD